MHGDVDGEEDDFKNERPKNIKLAIPLMGTASPPVLWGPRRKTGTYESTRLHDGRRLMLQSSFRTQVDLSGSKTARKHLISVSRVAPQDWDRGSGASVSQSGTLDVRLKRRRHNSDSHQCCCSRHHKVGAKIAACGALGPNNNHLHQNNLHHLQSQQQYKPQQLHRPEIVTGRCRYCHRLLVKVKAKGVGGGTGVSGALKQWWRDVGALCPSRRGSSAAASAVKIGTNAAYSPMGHGFSAMCKIHRFPKSTKGLHLRHSEEPPRMPGETGVGGPGAVVGAGGILRLNRPSYDREHAHMEAWLDEHPDFVLDYFLRKATRSVVDAWLVSHSTPTSSTGGSASTAAGAEATSPTHPGGGHHMPPNPHSRTDSGATTPVRKISAHEFSGLSNKPMVNTVDGTPTFLTTTTIGDAGLQADGGVATTSGEYAGGGGGMGGISGHSPTPGRRQRRSRHELRQLDEKELIFELVKDICNELEIRSLCHKILQNVLMLLHADRGSLFLVQSGGNTGCGSTVTVTGSNMQAIDNIAGGSITGGLPNIRDNIDDDDVAVDDDGDVAGDDSDGGRSGSASTANGSSTGNNTRTALVAGGGTALTATLNGSNGSRLLVSKLFDVCSKSTLLEMEKKEEIRIPWGTGIVGYVAESGESVNIPNAYEDERFNEHIDTMTGYKTKTLLCMPIKDTNGDVIGVAQVINKVGDTPFTSQDEQVFGSYLQFCGIGLRNAHLYEKSQLEIKRNQVLLDLARMIFEEQSTIEHVVFRILTHTQSLIQCQRVQVLLVHQASKGSFSRVFDFEANDLASDDGESRTSPFESRFPINIGITGYVATTGETVNTPCAYDDARFDTSVDDNSNFKHKGILCMPIKNSSGQIIGVIQLINKFDESPFSKNDENFVEAFAIFCGMGIHNTHMYERAVVAIAKHNVTLEVLSYHATASLEDAQRLRKTMVPSSANLQLHEFSFDDIHMTDDETITACIRMFLDLDLIERFHMDYEVLCRWLLSVKKNYRNVTYHNWRHAFNVAQMMFSILTATGWWSIFGEIECLALIIGCLCHDLDHRGTNNSFQIKASSPLAQLYSTSTMEHHHFDQCIMILNSPGNQLLANVSSDEYTRVIRYVEEAILSTDLAVYFRKRGTFFSCVSNGNTFTSDEDRELMRAMLMTVCDLAAITKPWEVEKRVAELVSSEFFEQGDMEKEELNITPIDLMNRDKEDQLPLMQVGFIDSICLPIYEHFSLLSETLAPLEAGVRINRQQWLDIAADNRLLPTNGNTDDPASNANGTTVGPEVASEGNPTDANQVTNGSGRNDTDDSSDNMKAESADDEDDDD